MDDLYKIEEVPTEWMFRGEFLGSKEKFWYRQPGEGGRDWLFKFPQPNTGQHWAEKIAAEIAGRLGIRHARVELAVADARRGSVTESFAGPGVDLWHGNQVLTGADHSYDREATFRHSSHTLKRIWDALEHVFTNPDWARRAKLKIADYIVLDAVIGNTDRHHENWGILRRRVRARLIGRMAPSFDHASALGRELLDERRKLLLDANRVGGYVAKGRGGVYWSEADGRAPSPLELVRRAADGYPDFLSRALGRLEALNEPAVRAIVRRVPADWMSPLARQFAIALVLYNLSELRRLM